MVLFGLLALTAAHPAAMPSGGASAKTSGIASDEPAVSGILSRQQHGKRCVYYPECGCHICA